MKKWLVALVAVLALLLAYVAAGPWLAIRGIHAAVESRDIAKLERYVDFDTLRANMRAKLGKRLLAAASTRSGRVLGGDAGRDIIGSVTDHAVDAMVSPAGIALLLEGSALAHRLTGRNPDAGHGDNAAEPLQDAKKAFESPWRFTATVQSAEGKPVVFVFERKWLSWKLSDIRLPE